MTTQKHLVDLYIEDESVLANFTCTHPPMEGNLLCDGAILKEQGYSWTEFRDHHDKTVINASQPFLIESYWTGYDEDAELWWKSA